jgi:hypothetical protein
MTHQTYWEVVLYNVLYIGQLGLYWEISFLQFKMLQFTLYEILFRKNWNHLKRQNSGHNRRWELQFCSRAPAINWLHVLYPVVLKSVFEWWFKLWHFVMYDYVLILLLSDGNHDCFNKVFLFWLYIRLRHWRKLSQKQTSWQFQSQNELEQATHKLIQCI